MKRKNKFSSNQFNDDTFNAKTIPDEVEPSLNIENEDLSRFRNENFVESVGVEYGNLVRELGTGRKKSEIERIGSAVVNGEGGEDEEKFSVINSNIDELEQQLINLRKKREDDSQKMLEKQRRINKKLNNIRDHQKRSKSIREDDIEQDVADGIDARLNVLTRKNLLLQEENKELNEIIVQKNTHIAKILKQMRELKRENERLEQVNKELGILAEQGNALKANNGNDRGGVYRGRRDEERGPEPISKRVIFSFILFFFRKI